MGATTQHIATTSPRGPVREVAFGFESRALAGADLWVVGAEVREALSEPYEAVVEIVAQDLTLDLDALLGTRCALELVRGPRLRRVCGLVRRVDRLDSLARCQRVWVHVVPALWALSQRTDSRIFQDLTVPEIAESVWKSAGLDPKGIARELNRAYLPREYCVQYRETDLAFVSRLLEEEGITYWFRHDGDDEVLVLADSASYGQVPTLDRQPVPYSPPQSELVPVEVVQRLDFTRELRPTSSTLRDHDFTRSPTSLDLTQSDPRGADAARALYDFPGRFTHAKYDDGARIYTEHDGARRAEVQHLGQQVPGQAGRGTGNVTGFLPGRTFELTGHERPELDQRYLITRVVHRAHAPEVVNAAGHEAVATVSLDRYRNEYECVPASVAFAPARRTPRPMVLATQTATVVGPPGEEIYVDPHGRIKVQFHWDREGKRDEKSSCWMRVAQPWAGAGWGSMFIPRVGMEVVVSFIEGDPDKPMVMGCVYNGQNRPPYELPDEKTKSTLRSSSSPGGNGFNELRFEDRADAEEVYLHAQRDHNEVVERHHTELVHGNKTLQVDGNHVVKIDGKGEMPDGMPAPGAQLTIDGEYNVLVTKAYEMQIGTGTVRIKSDNNYYKTSATGNLEYSTKEHMFMSAEGTAQINAKNVRIYAADSIHLQVGGSTISITPGNITIFSGEVVIASTGQVKINGAPIKLNC